MLNKYSMRKVNLCTEMIDPQALFINKEINFKILKTYCKSVNINFKRTH